MEKKCLKCTTFVCFAEIGQSWIIRDTQRIQCPGFVTARNQGQALSSFLAKTRSKGVLRLFFASRFLRAKKGTRKGRMY